MKELLGRLEARRTFLFTDIVDSTRLLETLGDDKWKKLLARHNELVRERIVESGGEVIKQTGDGFFASFENPKAAIEAAVAIQRALDDEIVAPDVRIGVHTGGAFHTDADATDYGGQGVHAAARIGAAAGAGRDPRQPRDARRHRERVPALGAARRGAQGLRAAGRRRLRRLALAAWGACSADDVRRGSDRRERRGMESDGRASRSRNPAALIASACLASSRTLPVHASRRGHRTSAEAP